MPEQDDWDIDAEYTELPPHPEPDVSRISAAAALALSAHTPAERGTSADWSNDLPSGRTVNLLPFVLAVLVVVGAVVAAVIIR